MITVRLLFLVLSLGAAPAAAAADIGRLTRWLSPGADIVAHLTRSPGECIAAANGDDEAYLIAVGRAAFRTPYLLGGQAARAGLSCQSCHIDGGGNRDFFLEGLSGEPGTADVTSSIFSKVRDDGEFNPAPIPSLIDSGGKTVFGVHAPKGSIREFVSAAITDEFQGAAPSDAVLDGVAAYVGALSSEHCPTSPVARDVGRDAQEASERLALAASALGRGDTASADFLLLSAQSGLGEIHSRFDGAQFDHQRARIAEIARAAGALRGVPDAEAIAELARKTRRLGDELRPHQNNSLYDADAIRAALMFEATD